VLPFKLKRTEEKITARSGLALFAEFFEAMGIERLAERYMPMARSGRGFQAIRYIITASPQAGWRGALVSAYGVTMTGLTSRITSKRSSAALGCRSFPVETLEAMPSTLA
jgi:hypothetical protein